MIKSVSDNDNELRNSIYTLYLEGNIPECDITYSIGNFYKNGEKPKHKFDKYPQLDDVEQLAAFSFLPDNSLQSIMCDPPFLIRKSEKSVPKMIKRFSGYKTIQECEQAQTDLLEMCYPKLKKKGILIYKIQDTKCEYGQVWTHQYVMNEAARIGYKIMDIFILLNKNPLPNRGKKQHCARKVHSYYIIFQK